MSEECLSQLLVSEESHGEILVVFRFPVVKRTALSYLIFTLLALMGVSHRAVSDAAAVNEKLSDNTLDMWRRVNTRI